MKRLVLALALLGTALGANAALFLRADGSAEPLAGTVDVTLSGTRITVPRALIRDRAQMAGGRLDRLDLAVTTADFAPVPPPSAREPNRPVPEHLVLMLTATHAANPDATDLFQTLYARFLGRETWSNPGGLVMRRFRPGTPYEDRELYIGAGGRRIFIALCPQDAHRDIEPCTALLRQDGLDAELRFNARHLPEWRRIAASSLALMSSLTADQDAKAAQVP